MGLFDSVIGSAVGSLLGGGNNQQGMAMKVIASLFQQSGGVGNLFSMLQNSPLSGALASWIGKGENQSVTGDLISSALGSDLLGKVSQASGVDDNMASNLLAQFLPEVVNKLTPNGDAAEADGFDLSDGLGMNDIAALAKKFLK